MSIPHLLLVDDDHELCHALDYALKVAGYSVQIAFDGFDALQYLRSGSKRPHLLLVDLMMPRMNGWELLAQLRANPDTARLPVILMSASHRMNPSDNADAFVIKPFDLNDLLDLIEKHRRPT